MQELLLMVAKHGELASTGEAGAGIGVILTVKDHAMFSHPLSHRYARAVVADGKAWWGAAADAVGPVRGVLVARWLTQSTPMKCLQRVSFSFPTLRRKLRSTPTCCPSAPCPVLCHAVSHR
jgi:hypothetical protein